MYVDTQLELSDAQAITATAISTNVIDTSTTGAAAATLGTYTTTNSTQDLGQTNQDIYLVVVATSAAAGGDSAKTLTITLESDTAAALNSANVVHFSTGAITGANITAGARLATVCLPHALYKRYVGLRYTVSASFTAFTVDAFLTTDPAGVPRTYATGFQVS